MKLRVVADEARRRRELAVLSGPQVRDRRGTAHENIDDDGEWKDPLSKLVQRVESLEEKVDTILSLLLRKEQQTARRAGVPLELWGQGLSFRWPEALELGRVLELELTLSLVPARDVFCLVKVTRVVCEADDEVGEGETPHFLVEANFEVIGDADLDAVHRFILTSQRQQRRRARELEQADGREAGGGRHTAGGVYTR
jgi:hypothetical protein